MSEPLSAAVPGAEAPSGTASEILYSADVSRIVNDYVAMVVALASNAGNYDRAEHTRALAAFDGMLHDVWCLLGCPSDETGLVGGARVIADAMESYEAGRQDAGQAIAELRTALTAAEHRATEAEREREDQRDGWNAAWEQCELLVEHVRAAEDEADALRAENEALRKRLGDPVQERPDGRTVVFMDELPKEHRAYLRGYRSLTPEQRKELQDFAEHLRAKHAARVSSPTEETSANG